ncbi:VCBS domain-containing protein [Bradyrhizobium sp. 44]|uniref:VCBS domain-containing protein n=1 Tax=Bradyrhizobium sp. 44 TaxID=2782675 RepID=UPI001FFACF03|nr:VCBS domain-containing protein [Bradyrhizobium sp. 44]
MGSRSPADGHVDSFTAKAHGHVPDGAFVVPDPNLIFNGDFKRAGLDLVLSHDGHDFVVHDYFRGDKRAAIASPDGAHLTGDVVNALTGHVQYAQAASGIAAAQVIGHVTKLSGSATAVRNGVSVILNNGDNVEKGDVVSTGGDSTLGITFIDGTVFGLSSNARMVLNEMVYDPNGSNNSSLLSLVAGTITFVAGETAKHGDMKVDTPVATMGIRGTAVLSQINFVVPAGGGDPQPQASFQVLVEPNGTTGSYILFDKVTLLPIATVNQAGQMIQISGGNVSISNALMSPDIQKLITDVFTLKFTDNNSNTKLTQNFTDSITQTGNVVFIKTDTGATATATFTHLPEPTSQGPGHDPATSTRIPGPPLARSLDLNGNVQKAFPLTERADTTGDTTHYDTISGLITFDDQNLGDRPTVSMSVADAPNYVYKDAGLHDVTGSLTALQKQDIAATLINIDVVANGGNTNHGSAVWTYTIPDHVFDFLAAGETLTLTYKVRVNNNFSVNPEASTIDITITITGTNDKPVITTSVPVIIFEGGTSVPGGPLTSEVPTSGTLTFKDVDLTDTHTVAVKLTSATLPDGSVPPGPLAAFQSAMSVAIAAGADSKGSGTGTINWSLADLPVYLADFIPKGEVLTLVYTVTLKDAQGATSQQTITVTITGTDAPAVVWIATDHAGAPSGGFWKDAANWETGTVPTINDDVIVITDQLHGLTPSYPVTIDAAAYAKSITMNDYDTTVGHTAPEVINKSALTIAGEVSLKADSKLTNFTASTISVGGKAEFLDRSVLTNAGDLTLKGGGDFAEGTTITNSGTIELFGGTLKTLAGINNAGGTLKADAGTTLIVDTATISGGTVTIAGTLELDGSSVLKDGTLNNSGAVNVKGTADFAHETVSNTSGGTIKVLANGWLTIDQGSTVANAGNVTVDANGKLTVNGATISGTGTATGNGEIDLTGAAVLSGGILNNNAAFKVSGSGNALDHETITNVTTGTIEVLANGALTIDQGSTVANAGNVTVDANGKLTVNGATISGPGTVTVTGNGEIDLTGAAVLSGGILNNNAAFKVSGTGNALDHETITNAATGTIEVLANGALTIDQGSTVANAGNVTVDANGKLTVNGATISGPGTVTVTGNGEIDLTGAAVLSGGILNNNAAFKVSGTGNALDHETITNAATATIEVLANGALTIDQSSTVANTGNITVDANGKLTVNGATINGTGTVTGNGEIDLTGAAVLSGGILNNNAVFKVSGAGNALDHETITNSTTGTIEVLANGALTIDQSSTVANTGNITVDANGKLTVNGATINGTGTVTGNGEIDLTGAAVLSGGILNNNAAFKVSGTGNALDHETATNATTGTIEVLANGALAVDQSSTVANTGNITVDANGKLTVNGATISGTGTVTGNGEIDLTGAAVLSGGILNNNAAFKVSGTGNALDHETITNATTGTIEVLANGALTVDQGSTVANAGNVTVDANGKLTVNGATISGGTIDGLGTIDVTGASKIDGGATLSTATVSANAQLTLDGITVSGSAITDNGGIELDNTVKLKDGASIQGGAVANTGLLEIAGAATLLNDVVTNTGTVTVDGGQTLTLSGTEISGGAVNGTGTIDVIGSSKIDKSATLSTTAVTVESGVILTLDDVTVAGTAIANHGTVKVDASSKLTLNGASLTGGALTVSGTLNSTGTTAITDANISNNYLIEATLGALTLLATTSASSIANDGILRANGAELDINGEAVANTGTLAAINHGTLKLIGVTVTDTGSGHVSVESGSILDLQGATIDGGTVTIAGTLESTGTSAINNADITNTGTITVTSGTLTIDPAILHTITNHGLIQANGGELDISGELIVNSADIMAVHGGTLKLASVIVTNSAGTITVDGTSKLYLTDVSINGGSLSNAGNLYGVSGSNTVSAMVTNTGTIEVQAGTLNLAGGLSGVGSVTIDNGATLELAGATAQTIAFAGGVDTLQLDKVAGQSFTGTITGQSTNAGRFTIKGAADITTSSGDALDFTASGGTSAAPADIVLALTGALTGAANGVAITQNGTGDISFTATGDIKGLAGHGIWLRDSATGAGDITVNNLTGKATGTGANSVGVLVENLNSASAGGISITQLGGAVGGAYGVDATTQGNGDIAIDAGGTITGSSVYGIRARSYGSGSETVTTEAGSAVTSGSSAIIAVNRANSIDASDGSTITVTTYGTINSGSSLNQSGNTPAGIQAGYTGGTTGSSANTNVNGTVTISNHANITAAAGYGIDAYNYGNGDVRVTSFAGTTISVSGTQSVGINASALSGGTGDVTVTLGENVTISGATSYGIRAYSIAAGDVSVTMANGDSITSGSTGIVAVNYATAIAGGLGSTISVEAHGTIHSGSTSNNDGTTPGGIIAGYKPGGTGTFSNAVKGDVTVTSDATIIADAGYGIEAFTWGAGNLTVTTGAASSITAAGTAIGAFDHGGGAVSVTNNGSAIGAVGVSAIANGSGDVTIVNHGGITSTSLAGISVTQNEVGATGSTHITNTGSIVAPSAHAAIFIQENATGTAQIDNSATGTIGPAVASTVTAATYAIVETGGHITINNAGHINGNISVASATFNNELGGTWTVAGSGIFGNASSIVNHGAIDLHGASISGTGLSVENYATIDSWGTASITGTVANTGSIEVHAGTLTLFGSLSGAGSVTVDVGAWLKLEGTVTATQTITLDGDGAHLQIDASTFGGSIAALSTNDTIDLSTIKYGLGTSAVYVANSNPSTGGVLTVTDADGNHISLDLAGADYSNAHFAGSDDGTGHTLITMTDDHAPAFTAGGVLAGSVSEQADTTGDFATSVTSTPVTGAIDFTDIDLTDLPTAQITGQVATSLGADHSTNLTSSLTLDEIAALKSGLTLLPQAGLNNGTVTWSYSIADGALDFLGENQSAKVVSTVTLDDHQGKTGTTDVTITITGKNDAPAITAETNDHSGSDLLETNTELVKHGTLTVSDADATDHVTVAVDHLDIYLDGALQTDYVGEPSSATLLNYPAVQPGDILNGSPTHATFTWDFNSGSETFDFLAAGHTLSLQYTITPDDSHTPTGIGNGVLTFNIAGSNDAPTLGDATLAPVSGDNRDPAGSAVGDLFAGKFHDADDGASFQAVAVSADNANSDQGVWQYEIAGSDQWVDIAGVSDAHALVLSTDTLVRFVPADGFTGTPASLGVHAIDNTYTGDVTTDVLTPATIDLTATGTGGATPISHELTAIDTEVTAPPANGPLIDTEHFQVEHLRENSNEIITDLQVIDTDSGAATDTFTVTLSTAHPDVSSTDLSPTAGSLDNINAGLANGAGITYDPTGASTDESPQPPATDQITLTVADSAGRYDSVNFIFNEAGDTSQGISLQGTSGKDVIFATDTNDTLTGGDAKDQFVFAPGAIGYDDNGHPVTDFSHSITDFTEGLDKIDLRQFSDISSIGSLTIAQQQGTDDTLVTWQQQVNALEGAPITEHESLLLKNVIAANLKGSDFIFHIT